MTHINQETKDVLLKVAEFINDVTPQVEKVAELEALQAQHEKVAEQVIDRLIDTGIVTRENRDASIREIREGGLDKYASVIDFVINNLATTPVMGKEADHNGKSASLTADQIWDRDFGTKTT